MSDLPLGHGLPHLGLMHLVATNLVIWLRTVIKETLHEMEAQHFQQVKEEIETPGEMTELDLCREKYHDDDFVSGVLKASSPFLYAFIIEFSLVGGTVFYNTWNNIHQLRREEVTTNTIRSANTVMLSLVLVYTYEPTKDTGFKTYTECL